MEHVVRLVAVSNGIHHQFLLLEMVKSRIDSSCVTFVRRVGFEFFASYNPRPVVNQVELRLEVTPDAELGPQLDLGLRPEIKDGVRLEVFVEHPFGPVLLHVIVFKIEWKDHDVVKVPFPLHCISLLESCPIHVPAEESVYCRVV